MVKTLGGDFGLPYFPLRIVSIDLGETTGVAVYDLHFRSLVCSSLMDPNQVILLLSAYKPDIILLDLLLSGRDGSEIAKEFKETAFAKDIPIVMISAHPNAHKSASESGADHFLAKPFDLDDLFGVLEKYTNGNGKA